MEIAAMQLGNGRDEQGRCCPPFETTSFAVGRGPNGETRQFAVLVPKEGGKGYAFYNRGIHVWGRR